MHRRAFIACALCYLLSLPVRAVSQTLQVTIPVTVETPAQPSTPPQSDTALFCEVALDAPIQMPTTVEDEPVAELDFLEIPLAASSEPDRELPSQTPKACDTQATPSECAPPSLDDALSLTWQSSELRWVLERDGRARPIKELASVLTLTNNSSIPLDVTLSLAIDEDTIVAYRAMGYLPPPVLETDRFTLMPGETRDVTMTMAFDAEYLLTAEQALALKDDAKAPALRVIASWLPFEPETEDQK